MAGSVKKIQVGFSSPPCSPAASPRNSPPAKYEIIAADEQPKKHVKEKVVLAEGWKLDDGQIDWLRENFDNHDISKTGALSQFEMVELWKVLFPYRSAEEIAVETEKIFSDIDADHDDEITFDELFRYLSEDATDTELLSRPTKWRAWIWAVVGDYAGYYDIFWLSTSSRGMSLITQLAIIASIVNMMIESLPQYQNEGAEPGNVVTRNVEATCIYIFTFEFIMRTLSYPGSNLKYIALASTWVDIASILPFYLMKLGVFAEDNGSRGLVALKLFKTARPLLRAFRYARVIRVLKLGRRSAGVQLMLTAIMRARGSMSWLCVFTLMAMSMSSALLFYAEKDDAYFSYPDQAWYREENSSLPDAGQKVFFQSIPDTLWWALVTLTTTGYGDSYPVTAGGKLVAGLTMMTGLLVVGYPITILTTVFQEVHHEHLEKQAATRRKHLLKSKLRRTQLFKTDKALSTDGSSFTDLDRQRRRSTLIIAEAIQTKINVPDNEDSSSDDASVTGSSFLSETTNRLNPFNERGVSPRSPSSISHMRLTPRVRLASRHSVVATSINQMDHQADLVPLAVVEQMISGMEKVIITRLTTLDNAISEIRRDLDNLLDKEGSCPPSPPPSD